MNEIAASLSAVILGAAACNLVFNAYHAPANLWTISEGLSRIPREFAVTGLVLSCTSSIIGAYSETYQRLKDIAGDKAVKCGCCSWGCRIAKKRFAQCSLTATIIGALAMIPTAYFRTGYDGEKNIHTGSSVPVFLSVIANASALIVLFKDLDKSYSKLAKYLTLMTLTAVPMLSALALKKFGKFKGSTMNEADCIEAYSEEVCAQRNAKTYEGFPEALQFTFALTEHATLGMHLLFFAATNGKLHPNAYCCGLTKPAKWCVGWLPDCPCCNILCCWNKCAKELQETEEETDEDKTKKCCVKPSWPKWCNWGREQDFPKVPSPTGETSAVPSISVPRPASPALEEKTSESSPKLSNSPGRSAPSDSRQSRASTSTERVARMI